jgi:hypothetical protein
LSGLISTFVGVGLIRITDFESSIYIKLFTLVLFFGGILTMIVMALLKIWRMWEDGRI